MITRALAGARDTHRLQSEQRGLGNAREEGATGTRDGVEGRGQQVKKKNQDSEQAQVATQIQDENSEGG